MGRSTEGWVTRALGAAVLCAVILTYSNHFHNSFHFDDAHSIQDNVFVRHLSSIPEFFSNAATQSSEAANRTWRPVVMTTLALDYWLTGNLENTFYFHLSTFCWFLVQLLLVYCLFRRLLDSVRPDPLNLWIAWFATAWYGLHPAVAETVNYIIQRADLLSTLGVVASLVLYLRYPKHRRFGLYLIPFGLGVLAKAPALVFPALLLAYVWLFEEKPGWPGLWNAARRSAPAFAAAVVLVVLSQAMTASSYTPSVMPAADYLITQPYVILRYFISFFFPLHLNADSDLGPFGSIFRADALGGFLFLAVLLYGIWRTAKTPQTKPISFGLVWFLLALAPTSLYPLAEVENDHRMFFPFIGLVLAVTWTGSLVLGRLSLRDNVRRACVGCAVLLLVAYAAGTRKRNEVWHSEETLWRDAVEKSPGNGRAFMNYGLALMDSRNYSGALPYLLRARELYPEYSLAEVNLALGLAKLKRNPEAEEHFRRAIQLEPKHAKLYSFYGNWLDSQGRAAEAVQALTTGVALDPYLMPLRYRLMQIYADHGMWQELRAEAQATEKYAPGDPGVHEYLRKEQETIDLAAKAAAEAHAKPTAAAYVRVSDLYYRVGRYADSIAAAREALRLKPDLPEAYNNIAADSLSMGQWDAAMQAASQALRLRPDFPAARQALNFATAQKAAAGGAQ